MEPITIVRSCFYLILAGFFEIGGGYLVWLWLRESKPLWVGLVGTILLALYGVIPTIQPASFGKVYAAYGGVFIVMALCWGWKIEGIPPDPYDILGASLALIGACIILFWPRA